jgi:hypothetical protein
MLFDTLERDALTALGEVRSPSLADLFVAIVDPAGAQAQGVAA